MLVLFTILLLVAVWGIIKPFKGFSRRQFALTAAAIFVVCLLITPGADKSAKTVAESETATSPQQADTSGTNDAPLARSTSENTEIIKEELGRESLTAAQNNAVRSAEQYLSMTGFSRDGLISQLSSNAGDGYSVADATAAVDSLSVDWNENAAKSAAQYLSMSGFSCKGLIEQLSSSAGDKYTVDQATYGARQAGAC
jgi:hypothetical protein